MSEKHQISIGKINNTIGGVILLNTTRLKVMLERDGNNPKSYSLLYHTIDEQEAWFRMIHEDSAYKPMIAEIKAETTRFLEEPLEEISYTLFKQFAETGSRLEYEKVYFEKRRRLNTFALMSLLEPHHQKYRQALHQIIWSICNEYSWCLPAHLKGSPEMASERDYSLTRQPRQYTIDLFATETAFALSEILQLTKNFLDPLLCKRITEEIYERVFWPYVNQTPFHWEIATHNWASVCAGSIGSAALHMIHNSDELAIILERVLKSFECYLDGFNDDGACLEGYGYWQYGFGFFVYFADLLKKKTAGKINLFDDAKVHQIALFQQRVFLHKNIVVNFSDAQGIHSVFLGLSHYLSDVYTDFEVPEQDLRAHYAADHTSRWAPAFRNLYWFDVSKMGLPWSENSYYLKESQWLISRYHSEDINYGFATKGGHNDEPHNHNDIGHFVLQRNGEVFLKDLGSGLYNEAYFSKERYSLLCNGSHGHAVPIVNGHFQTEGRSRKAVIHNVSLDNGCVNFVMDMTKVYALDSLQKLTREFNWEKAIKPKLRLIDTYTFIEKPTSIVERLIIPDFAVEEDDQGIIIQGEGRLRVMYNREQLTLRKETLDFMNHFGQVEKVQALDFTVINPGKRLKIDFEFQFE